MHNSGYIREDFSSVYCHREKRNFRSQMQKYHVHNVYELYYLFDGRVQYSIEGETYDLKEGSIVFISKEIPHKTMDFSSHHERFLIMFNDEAVPEDLLVDFKNIIIGKHLVLPPDKKHKFELILADMEKEKQINDSYSARMLKKHLQSLIVFVLRNRKHIIDKSDIKIPSYIDKITKYISENFSEDIKLERLSQTVFLNKTYMSRKFKELTGISISDYISAVRIEEAVKLLRETSLSVTEIASKCGFNNNNYFSAVFKKRIGTLPLKYRKENKGDMENEI